MGGLNVSCCGCETKKEIKEIKSVKDLDKLETEKKIAGYNEINLSVD